MRRRSLYRLIALASIAATVGAYQTYRLVILPWQRQWGATGEEARRALPGDERIPRPDIQWTRAITVRARPADIWPWLMQIGQGRAGYYSYPWLEQLMGLRVANANEINPDWQRLRVGDMIPAEAGDGYYVITLEPERRLALSGPTRATTGAWGISQLYPDFTWVFTLDERADGQTRLITRMRAQTRRAPLARLMTPAIDFGAFWLKRKMLLGIRQRAEDTSAATARVSTARSAAATAPADTASRPYQ